ncbi:MAG: tyrosine--tRNA ligase [Clostridiaceae bacterium]|nr:tyrosine--tRNA ligase [Clostridiaceae bacterium]
MTNEAQQPNVVDTLAARGYLAQSTDLEAVREMLSKPGVRFYIGFDPTADSLHVGHFIQMMILAHLQRAGHVPIALLGGGTGMIGDPSGRSDLRTVMTRETVQNNVNRFRKQMSILVDFSPGKAFIVDNADWLLNLNYVDFLRDVGAHFSVNRMLTAEAYKIRMESGLTFLEFNYMIMQAYDFYRLYLDYDCKLQLGGNDQWSNIIAGVELIRRKTGKNDAQGLTTNLLLNSEGNKMGKTARGAVWLDEEKFSVYDFYQYWRNVADADVINCLKLLTFVPLDEIEAYAALEDQAINEAKKRLALEITTIVHGEAKAKAAERQAIEIFEQGGRSDDMVTTEVTAEALAAGLSLLDILLETGLVPSKSEGRRMVQQGGVTVNDTSISDVYYTLDAKDAPNGEIILRRGKKKYHRLLIVE